MLSKIGIAMFGTVISVRNGTSHDDGVSMVNQLINSVRQIVHEAQLFDFM